MPDGAASGKRSPALRRVFVSLAALSLFAGALLVFREGDRRSALESETTAERASEGGEPSSVPELPMPNATDPTIAVGNLEVQIRSAEQRLAKGPLDPGVRRSLVSLLLTHGEFVGRIVDYEQADELAEKGVTLRPEDPEAYQTRARVRSVFHRFEEASADLARAESLGAPADELVTPRASLLAARGNTDEALALLEPRTDPRRSQDLALLGLFYLEVGRESEGEATLERSRAAVRDVAPFPLAWLDYHEGEIRERHGQEQRAHQLYARAHRLLPTYAVAASHLAPYLGPGASARMLGEVARRSDDPEVSVFLAEALRKQGRSDEAARATASAAVRYDELLGRHEAAFADHAARFLLGDGKDPERAYVLSRKNLELRQTSPAFDLALTAALVTKRDREACDIAARGLEKKHMDESFRTVATSTMASRCGPATSGQ